MAQLYEVASKEGIKVCLSGDGADEYFFGYNHYYKRSEGHPILKLRYNGYSIAAALLGLKNIVVSPLLIEYMTDSDVNDWVYFDQKYRLSEHLCLVNNDIPAIYHNIESRLPFLDFAGFYEFCFQYEPKQKLKSILNNNNVDFSKEKSGLSVPFAELPKNSLIHMYNVAYSYREELGIEMNNPQEVQSIIENLYAETIFSNKNIYYIEIIAQQIFGLWSFTKSFIDPDRDKKMNNNFAFTHTKLYKKEYDIKRESCQCET